MRQAELIAFYVPMHTATRLTVELLEPLRRINPKAHLCAYGLYASLSAEILQAQGITSLLGGEFEQALVDLAEHVSGLSATPHNSSSGFECIAGAGCVSWCRTARDCLHCGCTRTWYYLPENTAWWATRRRAAVANIFAGIARSCRCTKACSGSWIVRLCLRISGSRWLRARGISRLAIQIFSMG